MRRIWKIQLKKTVSVILFGVLLLGCSMVVKTQAQATVTEVDARIEQAVQDKKSQEFLKENESLIQQIKAQYKSIQVIIGTGGNSSKDKIYEQLIQYLSHMTQIPYTTRKTTITQEELPEFMDTQADVIFGIVLPEEEDIVSIKPSSNISFERLEGDIFQNSLLLGSYTKNGTISLDHIPNYYWGSIIDYEEQLRNTMLNNHMVYYNTYSELMEACEKGHICGMLLPESYYEYDQTSKSKSFEKVEGFSIPASEYYVISSNAKKLTKLLNQIVVIYDELYDSYFTSMHYNEEDEMMKDTVMMLGSTSIVGLSLLKGVLYFSEQYKLSQMKKKLSIQSGRMNDILCIDMKRKKVCSTKGFRLFGFQGHRKNKKISMKHLRERIGFDFYKYYEYIIKKQQLVFQHSFTLYINGIPYEFEEEGRVEGRRLVTIIYRK